MNNNELVPATKIAVFRGRKIRKTIHKNEWWFAIEDVVLALIDSNDPKQYIQRMKQRDNELAKGWVQIVHTIPQISKSQSPNQRILGFSDLRFTD
jgi:prophage antirepressor-like protein